MTVIQYTNIIQIILRFVVYKNYKWSELQQQKANIIYADNSSLNYLNLCF